MNLELIIHSKKTVFRIQDLLLILETDAPQTVRNFLQRMKKKDVMRQLYYGIRGLRDYSIFELACKLKSHSYISCETVLKQAGVIFQYYGNTTTCVSDNTITKSADGREYIYRKVSAKIRLNPIGIDIYPTYMIASAERALCDVIYLYRHIPDFDDISVLNHKKTEEIAQIYPKRVGEALHVLFHKKRLG